MIDLLELKEWHESQRRRTVGIRSGAAAPPISPQSDPASEESQMKPLGNEYIPTPATIRRRCLEIQAEWSTSERRKRAAGTEQCRPAGEMAVHRLWAPTPECA